MTNFKSIINDAKNKAVSASKLLQMVKDDETLNANFIDYLGGLHVVCTFEGKNSHAVQFLEYWNTVSVSQFVAFISKNVKDTRKIDGSSLIGALKTAFSVKDLQLLVLPAAPVVASDIAPTTKASTKVTA